MIFKSLAKGSQQYEWLKRELNSREFRKAKYKIVLMHESPQSLGDNVIAPFTDPVEVQEKDRKGNVVGIRYEYPQSKNQLLHDVQPLLEKAGVQLVYTGHSHLWNRFKSQNGTTNWLESSNTGNSYGAHHELSGAERSAVPPAPWNTADHPAQGNPGEFAPIMPNLAPVSNKDGVPTPFLADNEISMFAILDTATGAVSSYRYDIRTPNIAPVPMDRFKVGR